MYISIGVLQFTYVTPLLPPPLKAGEEGGCYNFTDKQNGVWGFTYVGKEVGDYIRVLKLFLVPSCMASFQLSAPPPKMAARAPPSPCECMI